MQLTEKEALEATAEVWLYKAGRGPSPSRCYKKGCPCCHYVLEKLSPVPTTAMRSSIDLPKDHDSNMCLPLCPLRKLWPKGCEHPSSVYYKWERAGGKKGRKLALQIAEEAKRAASCL